MNTFTEGTIFDYVKSNNGSAKIADFHQTKISGAKLNPGPNANLNSAIQTPTTNVEGKNNNTWIYLTIGAIALVGLAVGVHYYLKRQEEKKEPRNKSSSI
ncbi:MAG: hypothetical protein IPO32_12200 [Crocinitomicaceae bacterium]|nr:hypothetical protein [Crocinitomicaceae bacterium]